MKSALKEGLFVTFEGGEGAGKTTIIEQIATQLASEGYSVLKTREPGGTKIGEHIRAILLQHSNGDHPISAYCELCLFFASRAQHIQEIILPALKQKKVVLCDRFNDSSIAYQGAARGLGMEEVEKFAVFISEGLEPQLTLYLDVAPELGLSRAKTKQAHDRIESEKTSFHTKIRKAYHQIQKNHPKRFHLLDSSKSLDLVYEQAMNLLHPLLATCLKV